MWPSLARLRDFPFFQKRPEFGPPGGFHFFLSNGPSFARQGDFFFFFQTS
jgi:hypothetical protein